MECDSCEAVSSDGSEGGNQRPRWQEEQARIAGMVMRAVVNGNDDHAQTTSRDINSEYLYVLLPQKHRGDRLE